MLSPSATRVLSAAAAHLRGACAHADDNVGDEPLSLWEQAAISIDLAAAGLSQHLPGPVIPTEHPDCLTALRAGADELTRLPAGETLPLLDAVLVRTQLAAALRQVQALQP